MLPPLTILYRDDRLLAVNKPTGLLVHPSPLDRHAASSVVEQLQQQIAQMQQQMNCDYHVHIGQYCRAYYYADRVFAALKACGTDELWFSSTTSCMYCKESAAARADTTIYNNAPAAAELYQSIRSEVQHALEAAAELGIQAHALYWVVPDIHFLQTADISIELAMRETPYEGFKIHPRAQNWDVQDACTAALAEAVFAYAERYAQRILIHCGDDPCESPLLFEPFIKNIPALLCSLRIAAL